MATFRQLASNITNDFRANRLDDRFSYRFLIRSLISAAELFFKQDAESRKLFNINILWKKLNCIDLEEVDLINCHFDIGGCKKIMKSTQKIPQTYQTSYGNVIKIINLNYSKEYKEIRPELYRSYSNRRFKLPQAGYFWIIDDYLYIPDSEVESVTGLGIFKNTIDVDKFNCVEGAECMSPLDSEFLFPDYIVEVGKSELKKSIGTFTKRVIVDENSNLNSNIKS